MPIPSEKMDPVWKQRWLDALRSGEYKRTDGQLMVTDDENNTRYCCLGVLTHIVSPNHQSLETGEYWLSEDVMATVGLDSPDPFVELDLDKYYECPHPMHAIESLSCLNDNFEKGDGFQSLSRVIEDCL